MAKGKSYSNIPIPQEHRHVFNGRKQRTQKWSGAGIAAWCHYVAAVDEQVVYILDPPEAALTAAPPSSSSGGLNDLESLKGRTDSDIQVMVEVLFHCGIPTRMISPKRLTSLRREWKYALVLRHDLILG